MPWNYRPWGCGKGTKGSCNSGWIQFECCEDGLTDASYFQAVYQEACEITAYLCKLYNIDPFGTVRVNGVDIPTILCHQDSYKLGFGSNHSDVLHWFPKFGKTMADARQDVTNLMNEKEEDIVTQEQFNEMMNEYIKELAAKPSTWESDAMAWAQSNGVYQGDETGNLSPKKYVTRGELATVLQRLNSK